MKHAITRLPFGADEGAPYLRVTGLPDAPAAETATLLRETYRTRAIVGVWLELPEYQSDAAVSLLVHLRAWCPVFLHHQVGFRGWPAVEARLSIDVSEFLSAPVSDWQGWGLWLAEQRAFIPDAIDELILRHPARRSLVPSALDAIDETVGAETAGFLYVDDAAADYALEVASRARRPWVVRLAGTAPAAAPPP